MTTPTKDREVADISRLAELNKNLRTALAEAKEIEAYIDGLKAQIKEHMGDKEVAKINGVVMFTYAKTDGYAWGEFRKAHPEIAQAYTITVSKEALDTERLLKEQATLAAEFQTRQFLVK